MFSLTFGSPGVNWLHINVVIKWQLSKTGYPPPDRIASSLELSNFLKVSANKLLVFKWSLAQVYFLKFIWNILCLCHCGPALLRFWFQAEIGRENSASYFKIQAEKTFSHHDHALVSFHVQFLCSDWTKLDRWVHAENSYSILKLWQLQLTEFCVNLWCFEPSFSTRCTKWNTAARVFC